MESALPREGWERKGSIKTVMPCPAERWRPACFWVLRAQWKKSVFLAAWHGQGEGFSKLQQGLGPCVRQAHHSLVPVAEALLGPVSHQSMAHTSQQRLLAPTPAPSPVERQRRV